MKLRVSIGTAGLLRLSHCRSSAPQTAGYIMVGERCTRNCSFCAQAKGCTTGDGSLLSRIIWPAFEEETVVQRIADARREGLLKRLCLQGVGGTGSFERIIRVLSNIKRLSDVPVSVSCRCAHLGQIGELLEHGANKACVALDAACKTVYEATKGKGWNRGLQLLSQSAARFPGRITTHLIIGMGETEEEAIRMIQTLDTLGVTVGLFAFTPVEGTAMEQVSPPSVGAYRRVQIARHLIANKRTTADRCTFRKGKLVGFGIGEEETADVLEGSDAFQTSGCPGCNRPFYTERPGGVLYNFPRPLQRDEFQLAIKESRYGS
jgi:biotin synthase